MAVIDKKLFSVKMLVIGMIPMLSRFNKDRLCYICIYPAFYLVVCAQLVFATFTYYTESLYRFFQKITSCLE